MAPHVAALLFSSRILYLALQAEIVTDELACSHHGQDYAGEASLLGTDSQDAAGGADGDIGHVLHQSGGKNPLVALQIVHGAPPLTRKLEDGLHTHDELCDVVLLILEMSRTAYNALVRLAIELYLVRNLQLAVGPLVCKRSKLKLSDIQQAELHLYLLLILGLTMYFPLIMVKGKNGLMALIIMYLLK